MVWSTDADDVKMLLDIPFLINYVIIDQLALNLVDVVLIIRYRYSVNRCYALQKLERLTIQKSPKVGLENVVCSNSKYYIILHNTT